VVTTTTSASNPVNVILPLDALVEASGVPIHRYFPSNHRPNHTSRYFSTSISPKEETTTNNNDDGGGDGDSNNTLESTSPLSSPLVTMTKGSSNTNTNPKKKKKRKNRFVPRKAAVELTDKARTLFQKLLANHPSRDGILLNYNQSSTGEPRMVFSFSFVSKDEIDPQDEGVSLEVDADGNPKPPKDALDDGLPKLYVHHNAFLKVLGAKVDVDTETLAPVLFDKEGFELDANV
jgi:hypothetical protein